LLLSKSPSTLWWIAALMLLATSGVVQGRLTGRWRSSIELTTAVARLDRLPRQVGTWKGEDAEVDRATLHRVGIADGLVRRYHDSLTGQQLTVMLVCGLPGPVSVHTPDICYGGAGYEICTVPAEVIPGFLASSMVRPDQPAFDGLQVYWSWNASGRWEAPKNPRFVFGSFPYVYKLYIIRSMKSLEEPLNFGPAADFAKALTASFRLVPSDH
jgi:hypothetical protein